MFSTKRSLESAFLFRSNVLMAFGWCLFGLSWLLPNHYNPWLNFHSETLALAAVAMLLGSVLRIKNQQVIQWPLLATIILALVLIPWAQWIFGVSYFVGDAVLATYYLPAWAAAIFLGYHFVRHGRQFETLMHVLWVVALLSAYIGLMQWLKVEDRLGIYATQTSLADPAMGNLAQPNQMATLMLIGVVAYAYAYERRVFGLPIFVMGIFFITAALVMTHSRAGMLGALTITAFYWVKRRQVQTRISGQMVLVWAALFVIATLLSPHLDQALLLSSEREPLFTSNGRIQLWLRALNGIRHSPWLGYGWNQTATAMMYGALAYPGESYITYAHNVLLDMLTWNGIPLGVSLIGFGAYWFFTRAYQVKELNSIYAMGCLLPFIIHSLVEFPFAYAYFLVLAGFMMGTIEGTRTEQSHVLRIRKISAAGTLIFLFSSGIYITYEYFLIEEDVRVTRFENLHVGATALDYQKPNIILLTQMAALQRASRQQPVPGMTTHQLEDLRQTVQQFPHGGLLLRYALVLGLNEDKKGALEALALVRSMYGERFYTAAKEVWNEKANTYPVLKTIVPPP